MNSLTHSAILRSALLLGMMASLSACGSGAATTPQSVVTPTTVTIADRTRQTASASRSTTSTSAPTDAQAAGNAPVGNVCSDLTAAQVAAAIGKVQLRPVLVHETTLHVDACSWFGGGHFLSLRTWTEGVSADMEHTLCSQNPAVPGLGTIACYQPIAREVDAFDGPRGIAVSDNGLTEQQLVALAREALASKPAG